MIREQIVGFQEYVCKCSMHDIEDPNCLCIVLISEILESISISNYNQILECIPLNVDDHVQHEVKFFPYELFLSGNEFHTF